MNRLYTILPEPLHETADLAVDYFIKRRGVPASSIRVEQPVDDEVPYRPTFIGRTSDNYILCVEVSESAYNNSLDAFVLNCMHRGLAVKLFIAIPQYIKDQDYAHKLTAAKARGVGVIQVGVHSCNVVQEALPLSLAAVRPIDIMSFPPRLRESLTRADTVFRNGSPDKACALVFDEIENLSRVAAKKTHDTGCWKQSVVFKFESGSWATLMELMGDNLDAKKAKCPALTKAFIARIHGVTPHRNESGHKPKDATALMKRDRELRTRFEGAIDSLTDLIAAVKPLRIV